MGLHNVTAGHDRINCHSNHREFSIAVCLCSNSACYTVEMKNKQTRVYYLRPEPQLFCLHLLECSPTHLASVPVDPSKYFPVPSSTAIHTSKPKPPAID